MPSLLRKNAFVALSLAMIGLFGLAAFMAAQRTKEIGVRKVLGASSTQIARLLVWQFSKPVMWALAAALPAAFLASNIYLDFFADRIVDGLDESRACHQLEVPANMYFSATSKGGSVPASAKATASFTAVVACSSIA